MRKRVGIGLVVAAYALLLYTSLAAPAYARAHPHLSAALLAEYAAPWPVALASSVAVIGVILALIPIRRGERWASWTSLATLLALLGTRLATDPRCLVVLDPHQLRRGERWASWTSLATLLALLGTRLATDPRCLVVLDPHQHGCHTFIIAVLLGVVGLALAAFG